MLPENRENAYLKKIAISIPHKNAFKVGAQGKTKRTKQMNDLNRYLQI